MLAPSTFIYRVSPFFVAVAVATAFAPATVPSLVFQLHRRPSQRSFRNFASYMEINNSNNMSDQDAPNGSSSSAKSAIDFLTLTTNLKTTKRTGWIRQGVRQPESIADHMYRMTLMAMISSFSNCQLDTNKCIKLALIHDLAEAKVGDITPHCGVSDGDKYEMELNTMNQISQMLGPSLAGEEILTLWKEYEEGTTEEAKLVKDLDKLEMILQAMEYENEGCHEESLEGFFESTKGKWRTELGFRWAEEIVSRRRMGKKDGDDMTKHGAEREGGD